MAFISTMEEFSNIVNKLEISAVYLFIGNGAKLQYDNMEKVKTVLGPVIEDLNRAHGAGQWLAVYGGDTWVEDSPDLGACMYWIKQVYKPYTMAVQGWMEHDEFVDYVFIYEEEKDDEGKTLYGADACYLAETKKIFVLGGRDGFGPMNKYVCELDISI